MLLLSIAIGFALTGVLMALSLLIGRLSDGIVGDIGFVMWGILWYPLFKIFGPERQIPLVFTIAVLLFDVLVLSLAAYLFLWLLSR